MDEDNKFEDIDVRRQEDALATAQCVLLRSEVALTAWVSLNWERMFPDG